MKYQIILANIFPPNEEKKNTFLRIDDVYESRFILYTSKYMQIVCILSKPENINLLWEKKKNSVQA